MIDLGHAKEEFEHYPDGYDRENDKVKLKIIHTYGVVECSRRDKHTGNHQKYKLVVALFFYIPA